MKKMSDTFMSIVLNQDWSFTGKNKTNILKPKSSALLESCYTC